MCALYPKFLTKIINENTMYQGQCYESVQRNHAHSRILHYNFRNAGDCYRKDGYPLFKMKTNTDL